MIIEYEKKYDESVKDLLVELQEHVAILDKYGYNIIGENFREEYFKKTIDEVKQYDGKIFLYEENGNIVGLIVGVINNEEIESYDFKAPKRGRITEFIVSSKVRSTGIGKKLIAKMEEYFKEVGCKDVVLGVFAPNIKALKFYEREGYENRMFDLSKKIT